MKRQPVDCYSRIVGYLSPLRLWNKGKLAEWGDRKTFKLNNKECKERQK